VRRTVSPFDLVIFDCDGVLVDSERLAIRIEEEILAELGWPLTEQDIVERFVGRSASHMQGEIELHLGRRIDWEREFETRYREVFERELEPVPGVVEALDLIGEATCVASSGSHERMQFTLGITGPSLASRGASSVQTTSSTENQLLTSSCTPPRTWVSCRGAVRSSKTVSRG